VSGHLLDEFAAQIEADERNRRFARRMGDPERAWAAEERRSRPYLTLRFAEYGGRAVTAATALLRRCWLAAAGRVRSLRLRVTATAPTKARS
jgi:hypothetical protein